ncbi:hypothetical protein B0H13DRAFT_2312769 [Mycena leptocephala]|nr:hypothetical protein B0H13DRAFT_2312769 [Mycena leptocephala]
MFTNWRWGSVNSQAGERSAAPSTLRPLTSMPVMIPAFPTAVFQPYEAVFCDRGHTHRTQLVALPKPLRSFFPLRWVRFDGDIQSSIAGHDVSISHGSVLFFFLAARVVAKTARRLRREFNAYAAMSDLQGAAIPRVVGLYGCKGENSVVLLVTYAGKPLQTFADLATVDGKRLTTIRRTLFRRLLSLHASGIQHNDFEPRNVTMFGAALGLLREFIAGTEGRVGVEQDELRHVAGLRGRGASLVNAADFELEVFGETEHDVFVLRAYDGMSGVVLDHLVDDPPTLTPECRKLGLGLEIMPARLSGPFDQILERGSTEQLGYMAAFELAWGAIGGDVCIVGNEQPVPNVSRTDYVVVGHDGGFAVIWKPPVGNSSVDW